MKRLPLIVLAVVGLVGLGLLSSIVTQGFQDLARAEEEHRQLQLDKEQLESDISKLEATLDALRSNPEAVESLARHELGWIRPGEQVVLIVTPTPPQVPVSLTEPTPTPILTLP